MTNSANTLEKRFFDKVKKTDSCWIWTGATYTGLGYGQIWLNRKQKLAHRISYEIHKGPIPKGMCICHTCDNRKCVNPLHLFVGSKSDNVFDMMKKKRHAKGITKINHKLKDEDIPIIRKMRSEGKFYSEIAKIFNVNYTTINLVCLGKTWRHVL